MTDKKIRIGILGCSKVLPQSIVTPAKEIDNLEIFGIASRDVNKAKVYAEKYSIKKVYSNYDELLQAEEVDFVYIALVNSLHKEWIIKAIKAKKHILVEKPVCLNAGECYEIEQVLCDSDVHILEGVMTQHHPWQQQLKDIINKEIYGKLKKIKTQISFQLTDKENNYRSRQSLGGGCFYDEGIYWLQFIQYILGLNSITSYTGHSLFNGPDNCDWSFNASLKYPDNIIVEFVTSFEMPYEATHWLIFDNAEIRISNFFRASLGNYKVNIDFFMNDGSKDKMSFPRQNYYVNQLRFFIDVINEKQENFCFKQSVERIEMMEKIYNIAKSEN